MSKEHLRNVAAWGTLAAIGAAGILGSGCGKEKEYCLSPISSSPAYAGDKTPSVTGEYKTWRLGVMAFVVNPPDGKDYEGTVVSYRDPNDSSLKWHPSDPIGKNNDAENVMQLGIGRGDVIFDVAFMGITGACGVKPDVRWTNPVALTLLTGTKPTWSSQTPLVTPSAWAPQTTIPTVSPT